jgi:predicted ATPase
MRLTKLYVRFYKSFNYDYERKFGRTSEPDPWEFIGEAWYPYVRIDLEPSVTTIVGANESGKSHLLDAVEKLITGRGIDRGDFCRYSHYFLVERGQRRSPDFGAEVEVVDADDVALAKKNLGLDLDLGERFNLFRPNGEPPVVYGAGATEPTKVAAKQDAIAATLPAVFRLDAHTPLPDSIPLYQVIGDARRSYGTRHARRRFFEQVLGKVWPNAEEFGKAAPKWYEYVSDGGSGTAETEELKKQYDLVRALLFGVANIDPTALTDLSDAIENGKEGYANAVIQKINAALATHLNFPRWWAQDREFRLLVSRSEFDLVFTIRDRTGTDYSFAERSSGLKFFLSYHVQLLAHETPASGQPELLLMDEPDAYLSSQGQQDLLRILEEFALPDDRSRHDQVVYVTHSPFLINRNAGERIRVLDKGVTDEGTRVVKDVARNHYEPLRSSLGSFVAETSFIGGSNLFVEGLADQVLLAGVSSHLLSHGAPRTDTLDLNTVTIVPSGAASSVPYLVYLARGRDVVRPACVVLLDSDSGGDDAVKALKRGGPRRKELIAKDLVVRIGTWAGSVTEKLAIAVNVKVTELEDLISLPVAVTAARNYAVKVVEMQREEAERLTEADIAAKLTANPGSLFDAVEAAFADRLGPDVHIEKIGFAKEVVAALSASRGLDTFPEGFEEVEQNFALILAELAKVLRRADKEEQDRRLNNRLNRTISGFLSDHPTPTTRERGRLLVEEVEGSLENSDAGDRIRLAAEKLRRDFELDEDLTEPIGRYEEFRDRVEGLRYEERLATQNPKVVVPVPVAEAPAGQPDMRAAKPAPASTDGTSPEAENGETSPPS